MAKIRPKAKPVLVPASPAGVVPPPMTTPKITLDTDIFALFGVDWKQHNAMRQDLSAIACKLSSVDRVKLLLILDTLMDSYKEAHE